MDYHFWVKRIVLLLTAILLYAWSWNHAFGNHAFGNHAFGEVIDPSLKSSEHPPLFGMPYTKEQLLDELKTHIQVQEVGENIIGHLIIEDQSEAITQATWLYIKTGLEHFKKIKPIFIILELNTPGGEVYPAQKISDALKEMDTQYNIPIVAYINNWAISAGAMIAYSCRFIAVSKDASMGAAEPVIAGVEGTVAPASEKINSAIRADFANRARYFDRDPLLAEAMVDKDLILVKRGGVIMKLDSESQIRSDGSDPDIVISPKGKLLTLNADQLMSYGVADFLVPPTKLEALNDEEVTAAKWPASKFALFHIPYFADIPHAAVVAYSPNWKMKFFSFLASPAVSSILMLGLMIGFYMEVTTPGFGLPGTIAATCLFLIILSSYSLEIANWLEIILLLSGMAVILVELFVLPTFGLLGFVGIAFFLIGLFGMMLPIDYDFGTNTLNFQAEVLLEHLAWFCATLLVGFLLIYLLAKYATPRLGSFHRLILKGNEQNGYVSFEDLEKFPKPGTQGSALTTLRPSGKVSVNDVQYDALSEDVLIEKGDSIVVVGLDGGTLLVARGENKTIQET